MQVKFTIVIVIVIEMLHAHDDQGSAQFMFSSLSD